MTAPDDRFDAEAERAADAADRRREPLFPDDEDFEDRKIYHGLGRWGW